MSSQNTNSLMYQEVSEIPLIVQKQIDAAMDSYYQTGLSIRAQKPPAFITCARGTSDQAAVYFKYLMEIYSGIPVASIGPSVSSVYETQLKTKGLICLSISQSGGSPDLNHLQANVVNGGAKAIALLNNTNSSLARSATIVLPLLAGPEQAVAATKSFVASLVAVATLVAGITDNKGLLQYIRKLPEALAKIDAGSWEPAQIGISRAQSLFTLSRGPCLAAAGEAALKLKETCRLHAEAYSAAEVLHGPIVLADRRFSALCFVPDDQGEASVRKASQKLKAANAQAYTIGSLGCDLVTPASPHPALSPIIQITAFYAFVERLAIALGENPDSPPGLVKVTETH